MQKSTGRVLLGLNCSLPPHCSFSIYRNLPLLDFQRSVGCKPRRPRRGPEVPLRSVDTENFVLSGGMVDYYEVLGVDDGASDAEIKSAYRALAKVCHPDISGDESGHNMCILLNEAYTTLMDPAQRREYNRSLDEALADEVDGYTGQPLSKWMANTNMGKNFHVAEQRAVFVDEFTCIGCKQCVWCAPATFRMEEDYGRSRVFGQWLNCEEEIQAAMDACPVSCIHWVDKDDLPALEFVSLYKMPRVNVGQMMAGQGGAVGDVWQVAATFLREREEKKRRRAAAAKYSAAQAAARAQAAAELARQQTSWFVQVANKLGVADAARHMQATVASSVSGSSSEDEYSAYQRVGRRYRARQQDAAHGTRGENGGRVPAERALVRVDKERRAWER